MQDHEIKDILEALTPDECSCLIDCAKYLRGERTLQELIARHPKYEKAIMAMEEEWHQ